MIVVVEHFLEGPAINYCLVPLKTFALFSLKRLDSDGAKLDSLHGAPGVGIPLQNLNSVEPGVLERSQKSFFGQRPEPQPIQSSESFCISSETSSSLTMSEITARPPFFRTRKTSSKSCGFDFGSTKLRTQLETTTSIESLAMSGRLMRSSSASSSAARNEAASVIGFSFNFRSSNSKSSARSWMRPLRNSTFT